jgi:2-dehydro-3-deoxyphosphooctonate aldolase (KDO 8-P synthase)
MRLNNFNISNEDVMFLIAGPCQLESLDHSMMIASKLKSICEKLNIGFVFKGSFDKANRTSISGKRGLGLEECMSIFKTVKQKLNIPVLTDVHTIEQCDLVKDFIDIIQIPAFLCRQTDLLEAAAKTGKIINIKKGQFLAPQNVKGIVQKMHHFGNKNIILTERGVSFGYGRLVVDMTGLQVMKDVSHNTPIVIDATHAVQEPSAKGDSSGGNRELAPIVARAALAATKIAGVFAEVHEDPDNAPSDGPNMIRLDKIEEILTQLKQIDSVVKKLDI